MSKYRAKALEEECIKSYVESDQYITTVAELQQDQIEVEKEMEQITGRLRHLSHHYEPSWCWYTVEAVLVLLIVAVIMLLCNSASLNWLLCYFKAQRYFIQPV